MMHCRLASYTFQTVNANWEVPPQELIVIGDFPFCVLQLCYFLKSLNDQLCKVYGQEKEGL